MFVCFAICLATKHLGVLRNSFKRVSFLRGGENRRTRENPLGARGRTNNKLNPHMASTPGFEPRPHWWEVSALTVSVIIL